MAEKRENQIRSGVESKPEVAPPEVRLPCAAVHGCTLAPSHAYCIDVQSTLWGNPFGVCNVMSNTANLWGRGIIQVSLGLNTAFALTWDGNILSWGGNSDFHKSTNMTDAEEATLSLNRGASIVSFVGFVLGHNINARPL